MSLGNKFGRIVLRSAFCFSQRCLEVLEDCTLLLFRFASAQRWLALRIALITLAAVHGAVAQAGFFTAPIYPAGTNPHSMVVGDFNGDGILDLAVANDRENLSQESPVSILLGKGDGSFEAPKSYAIGQFAYSLAVGDFNGDGYLDLAVTGADDGGNYILSILLGNGDGTFQVFQTYLLPSGGGVFVAVGDFNGDGVPDLMAGKSLLLGNGDGTFQPPRSIGAAAAVAVGDFNGDGILDLVVIDGSNTVGILLGIGDGTFRAPKSYAAGNGPTSVLPADFNGDGILDLAVFDYGDGTGYSSGVSILLGNGDGTFQAARSFGVALPSGTRISMAVGDLNGDGHLDLVLTGGYVGVFLGNGDGTFQTPVLYAACSVPSSVVVRDFNGDGIPDLAVAANTGGFGAPGTVSILVGKGDGTFHAARCYEPRGSLIAVGDFNGDGIPDLAMANYGGRVGILLGNGDGTFQAVRGYAAGTFPTSVAVGDFNGDGIPDLAVANDTISGTICVLLGNGDGSFQAPLSMDAGSQPNFIAVGDFNGDGKADLVTTNFFQLYDHGRVQVLENGIRVFLGNGDGTFQAGQAIPIQPSGSIPSFVAVGDFNGDGTPDLAVANFYSNTVSILLGNGDGSFRAGKNYGGSSPAVGDVNGDGVLDLVVADFSSNTVKILLGNGDGTFHAGGSYAAGYHPDSVALADFNHDGITDIAVADADGTVSILLGNGDGSFRPAQSFAAGPGGSLAVGDFNGDGFPDLVLFDDVTILLNDTVWP